MKVLFFVENMFFYFIFFINCCAGLKVTIKYFIHLRTLENKFFNTVCSYVLSINQRKPKQTKNKTVKHFIFCEVAGRSFFFFCSWCGLQGK